VQLEIVDADEFQSRAGFEPAADLFQSPPWLAVLRSEYAFKVHAVADAATGDHLFASEHDDLLGPRLICLPFSDCVRPPIADSRLPEFVDALRAAFPGRAIVYKARGELPAWFLESGWTVSREAWVHEVDVAPEGDMWKALSPAFRRGVEKARRRGALVRAGRGADELQAFHRLHSALRKAKFHSLPQPLSFFRRILEAFGARAEIMEATMDGAAVASLMVVYHQDVAYYKFGASAVESLEVRPNNLLFWSLLQRASEKGCRQLDLGLSGRSASYAGLVRFKEQLGGRRAPITYYRSTPAGFDVERETEARKLLSSLTSLFVDPAVDIEVARRAGELLYRYFA
jgi:hypothetical protein